MKQAQLFLIDDNVEKKIFFRIIMMRSSNLNSLIAEEEENVQKLVLKNYIPTLIIISCFLVCISIFGLIGNWLVVHTIGRHIFRKFFELLESCLRILGSCSRCKSEKENHIQNQKPSQCRQESCQQRSNHHLDICLSRASSLVPISQSSNSVSNNELRNQGGSLTSVNNASALNIHQSPELGNDCTKNRETTKTFTFTKRNVMHTDLNSDLLIVLLAINDLIICVIDIPTTIFLIVWETRTYDFICRLHVILKSFTLTVSALFLVIIALDRWLLVCFIPCVIMTKKCMKRLIIGTYILGLLWAIPMGLHQGVHTYFKISTVDKLVSSDSEAIIMFHELNSSPKTNQSQLNGSVSDSSLIPSTKSSLTYFTSQFIDLITSFTNYGYCKSDERFISQILYSPAFAFFTVTYFHSS
ncbi:putative g-protein coupled receptor fragment [Schistosoma mansoni]|nr:putative g-protein coupled receptor fragment [Schistosoma mansoni]